jgi:hypothetical protein
MMDNVPDRLAYLSMTCANPSDHLSAGLWCETANEAYILARNLYERLEEADRQLGRHLCYTSDSARERFWQAVDAAVPAASVRVEEVR